MSSVPEAILRARMRTEETVEKLRAALESRVDTNAIIGDHTTLILTGSGGRGEMSVGSDLDGYVVRVETTLDGEHDAALLSATTGALKGLGLPKLDREGAFLKMRSADSLVDHLGSPHDDSTGALTTRMLFLLEGRPLLGEVAYEALEQRVQAAYRNAANVPAEEFQPYFLINDVVRYWRTVLLNHEDRLRTKKRELIDEGMEGEALERSLLAHRRYRTQKLRFPRCTTCFSAIGAILAILRDAPGLDEETERQLFAKTPMERLEYVAEIAADTADRVQRMLALYAAFLERNDHPKRELIAQLTEDESYGKAVSNAGRAFTEEMFLLLQHLGQGGPLYRQLII